MKYHEQYMLNVDDLNNSEFCKNNEMRTSVRRGEEGRCQTLAGADIGRGWISQTVTCPNPSRGHDILFDSRVQKTNKKGLKFSYAANNNALY